MTVANPAPSSLPTSMRPRARRTRALVLGGALACAVGTLAVPAGSAGAVPPVAVAGVARLDDPAAAAASEALVLLDRWVIDGGSGDAAAYAVARNTLAAVIAARLELSAEAMSSAWAAADLEHQQALLAALSQLGVPYRRNTSKPGQGFDCSGLTTYAWSQAGFALPRNSGAQIRAAEPRDAETAQAGDLVQYPGHVMMWLGVDRAIVHAPQRGRAVEVDVLKRRSIRFGNPTE
ncbi:MAG: NlpC/P60 family protein [Actinomycetota bacterium]